MTDYRRVKFLSRTAFVVFLLLGVAAQLFGGPCGSGPDWVDTCVAGSYVLPWDATGAVNGGPPVSLSGLALVSVGPAGGGHVPIELVSLSLTGAGGVTLKAGSAFGLTPSFGGLTQQGPGSPLADSFFDIFFELDGLPGGPLHNTTAAHLLGTGLLTWPDGTVLGLTNGPLPLFNPGGGAVAQLTSAGHGVTPPPPDIPEPMSVVILGSGLAGIFLARKKLGSRLD